MVLSHHLFHCFRYLFITIENVNNKSKGDGIVSTEEDVQPTIAEHIAFAIGNITDLVCKHSYVISNITMMVSHDLCDGPIGVSTHIYKTLFLMSVRIGLEYRLSQLVDVCLSHRGRFTVDHSQSTEKHAPNQSICCDLC